MKKLEKKDVKIALIIIISVLVLIVLIVFGIIMATIVGNREKIEEEKKYTNAPIVSEMENQVADDDSELILGKLAKEYEYCTNPDCRINEDNHLHFGDRLAYDPTNLKEGKTETSLKYTTYPIDTGEGTASVTFDAAGVDKITDWYVIGKENGSLVLLAGTTTTTTLQLKGALGVINSSYEMNKACEIYGNGVGAERATALTLEQLNGLVGVTESLEEASVTYKDKTPVEYLFNYGTEMQYQKGGRDQITHIDPWTKQGQVVPTYITKYIVNQSPLKVKSGYYGYSLDNAKISQANARIDRIKLGLNKDMWLATIGMNADETNVRYGPAGIGANNTVVSAVDLFSSDGTENSGNFPVRPILRLSPDVTTGIIEKVM